MEEKKENKADLRNVALFMLAKNDGVSLTEEENATLLTEKIEKFPPELYENLIRADYLFHPVN